VTGLPPLLASGIGVSVRLIEFGVTSVIVGGLLGFSGKLAAITKISGERMLSPIKFTADTLKR
jgi:hypothetical protein